MKGNMNEQIPDGRRPPDGMTWRCRACGKWADDRHGMIGEKSRGWDVICAMNAEAVTDLPPWAAEPSPQPAS
jgi:hypothetical protein